MELSEHVRPRCKATWVPVPLLAQSYAPGHIWRTGCLKQNVVTFDNLVYGYNLICVTSSVATAGRHKCLHQEPE